MLNEETLEHISQCHVNVSSETLSTCLASSQQALGAIQTARPRSRSMDLEHLIVYRDSRRSDELM